MLAAAAIGAPCSAVAPQAPDLAQYDCTLADGGAVVSGDKLLAEGFRIMSVGRFGQPNVMLSEPNGARRANCFVRQEPRKEDRN